jgi:hypothetical protein
MDIKEKDSLSPSCPRPGAPLVSPSDASEPPDLHQQGKKRSQYNPDDSLALPREILFVVVVCMAQFCTRRALPNILPFSSSSSPFLLQSLVSLFFASPLSALSEITHSPFSRNRLGPDHGLS